MSDLLPPDVEIEQIFKKHADNGAYARVDQIGPCSAVIDYYITLEGEFSLERFKKFIKETHEALKL